jgi:hypothetical protein
MNRGSRRHQHLECVGRVAKDEGNNKAAHDEVGADMAA